MNSYQQEKKDFFFYSNHKFINRRTDVNGMNAYKYAIISYAYNRIYSGVI